MKIEMKIKCKKCKCLMTWAEQRVQWGRWIKKGFSKLDANENMPLCNKCNTKQLKVLLTIESRLMVEGS